MLSLTSSFGCFSVYMVLEYVTKMAESFAEKGKYGVLKVIMFTPSSTNTKQLDGRTHHGKVSSAAWSLSISQR